MYGTEKLLEKRPKSTDPSERWKSFVAFSSLRIAPYLDVEMLPTGQFSLSSTLWQPQTELGQPVDIESKGIGSADDQV